MTHHTDTSGTGIFYIIFSLMAFIGSSITGIFNSLVALVSPYVPHVQTHFIPEPAEVVSAIILAILSTTTGFICHKILAFIYKKIFKNKAAIIIISLGIGLSSCATQKMCNRKFPPMVITKDSIVIKDTTIIKYVNVPVPSDTVRETIEVMIDCDKQGRGTIRPINKTSASSRAKVNVKIEGNKIIATASCDSLNMVITTQEKIIKELRVKQQKEIQAPPKDTRLPWYVWYLAGMITLFVTWLLLKVFLHI